MSAPDKPTLTKRNAARALVGEDAQIGGKHEDRAGSGKRCR